ncbi:MAG: PIN domain-containing protein [Bifidobacteriaceae bacterium]|jgi:toxin-antitoxin system PIN domain toxin|nr:PIN domain-containing protein [Bifidobacteriaceae bacterium]
MIVVDVNVLVAAAVADHPQHALARSWLVGELATEARGVIIPDLAWVGLVRIVTNHRVFTEPLSIGQVAMFAETILAAPGYLRSAGDAGPRDLLALCAESAASGNLVPDAYLASVALRLGCPVATFDRDFRRFDGLQVRELADAPS